MVPEESSKFLEVSVISEYRQNDTTFVGIKSYLLNFLDKWSKVCKFICGFLEIRKLVPEACFPCFHVISSLSLSWRMCEGESGYGSYIVMVVMERSQCCNLFIWTIHGIVIYHIMFIFTSYELILIYSLDASSNAMDIGQLWRWESTFIWFPIIQN